MRKILFFLAVLATQTQLQAMEKKIIMIERGPEKIKNKKVEFYSVFFKQKNGFYEIEERRARLKLYYRIKRGGSLQATCTLTLGPNKENFTLSEKIKNKKKSYELTPNTPKTLLKTKLYEAMKKHFGDNLHQIKT